MTDELDAAFAAGFGVPAAPGDGRRMLRYAAGTARRILRRTREGEALRAICRSPGMPSVRTVRRWMEGRPRFGAAMAAARAEAGRSLSGRTSSYCRATAEAIFERLCAGEAMCAICADPSMPAASTVYRWMGEQAAFREAVGLARQIQSDRLAEQGLALAEAATPETAYLTDVRLKHLRWFIVKLWPRKYGPVKALALDALAGLADGEAAGDGPGGGGLTVVVKQLTPATLGAPADGEPRYQPGKVLYRIDGAGVRTEGNGALARGQGGGSGRAVAVRGEGGRRLAPSTLGSAACGLGRWSPSPATQGR